MPRTPRKPGGRSDAAPEPQKRKKRNAIFLTLDDETEDRLNQLIARHRIKPDRAAVAFTALIELLDREGIPKPPAKKD